MSSDDRDIWYQLGYAIERLRDAPAKIPALETLKGRRGASSRGESGGGRKEGSGGAAPSQETLERLFKGGARSLATRLLFVLPLRKRAGMLGLVASAVAGAAAAGVAAFVAALGDPGERLSGDHEELVATLLAGAGRGVTYAGVLEPRIPGPALTTGFLYGSAEYLTASWGGVTRLLGPAATHRKLPFLSEALEGRDRAEAGFPEHLVFGLALALFYDALRPKRGMPEDDEE